ncbi:hypothetical protein Tco_0299954 [Tanacetum coccineum]
MRSGGGRERAAVSHDTSMGVLKTAINTEALSGINSGVFKIGFAFDENSWVVIVADSTIGKSWLLKPSNLRKCWEGMVMIAGADVMEPPSI